MSAPFLGPDPGSPGPRAKQIGWSFDLLPDQNQASDHPDHVPSRVSNLPANVAGVTRTNTASAGFGYTSKPTTRWRRLGTRRRRRFLTTRP